MLHMLQRMRPLEAPESVRSQIQLHQDARVQYESLPVHTDFLALANNLLMLSVITGGSDTCKIQEQDARASKCSFVSKAHDRHWGILI
jgi:hypothetical protein